MPQKYSLVTTDSINLEKVDLLFSKASQFQNKFSQSHRFKSVEESNLSKVIALVFFEPSTRTRMSFEMAAHRLNLRVLSMGSVEGSSLKKGESLRDTIMNINALRPDAFVIRCGDEFNLDSLAKKLDVPVINAGSGVRSHPTQALLDCFTLWSREKDFSKYKVLFVGDILHSRVASSNIELLQRLGASIGLCGPKEMIPNVDKSSIQLFDNLEDGLAWSNVCMMLRIQAERHGSAYKPLNELNSYQDLFRLDSKKLKKFSSDGIIMHPGPINHGVELCSEVLLDPRCVVMDQVENGVYVRAAILSDILELSMD